MPDHAGLGEGEADEHTDGEQWHEGVGVTAGEDLMSDLTAIDILILPDDTMLQRAGALNAPIRASVPGVFDAVGGVIGAAAPGSLQLRGVKLAHMEVASTPGWA